MSTAWSRRGRRRGRGRGAPERAPVQPTPPAVASGQPPAYRSGAATRSGSSPRLNQVMPITAAEAACLSSSSTSSTVPGNPRQVVQQGAAGASRHISSSPSPARVEPPIPEAAAGVHNANYVNTFERLRREFRNYLRDNKDYYKKQIHVTLGPCELQVSFDDMVHFNAASSMIRAACSSVKQNSLHAWLIPAAQDFLRDNGVVNVDTGSNMPCISFRGFPESIQNAEEYKQTNGAHVQRVSVCRGESSVTTLTDHGSIFIEILTLGILEHHSQCTSWGGTYSSNDIHIIKWTSRSHQYNHGPYTYQMKILRKPIENTGQNLGKAMARDLRKAAEILTPLYVLHDDWPPHILDLKEKLEGAKQDLVRKAWFIQSLSQHPGIMPSTGRILLLTKLHHARFHPQMHDIMRQSPAAYPNGWKTVMQSAIDAEKRANRDDISLLETFYTNDNQAGTKYDHTASALIRFIRNVIVHEKYPQYELEWYFAKIFSRFLPSIVRTLLETERMQLLL